MTPLGISIKRDEFYPIDFERGEGLEALQNLENVVTDENVFATLGQRLLLNQRKDVIIIPAGEQSKSPEEYDRLVTRLEDAKEVVALGGGVVTDLVGYVASTLKRGLSLVNIPTSLVGMVDAAIGGKNGINKGLKKNHLGIISQPDYVLVDPSFLETLPRKEFRNGVAEIIKYGAISEGALLERCATPITLDSPDLENIIRGCIKIKKYFVEKDEKDQKERRSLNFGHTFAHGIELPLSLSHGEAVAIGLACEAELAVREGIYSEARASAILKALEANGLPATLPAGADIDRIIQLMRKDKKGPLVFAFDETHYSVEIPEEEVRSVLR